MAYRGETHVKEITRRFVWWQHQRLLGSIFRQTPHVFLASHIAGDIPVLRALGVKPDDVWAVESDMEEARPLLEQRIKELFRVFPRTVEMVMEEGISDNVRSVYLDYCGNIHGMRSSRRRVMRRLSPGTALSVTHFLGREIDFDTINSRETKLLMDLRKHTDHPVTLVQSIRYSSYEDGDKVGSPMMTWTFYVGRTKSRSKMRFDLSKLSEEVLAGIASSESEIRAFWLEQEQIAESRSKAAVQANVTRRKAA